MMISLGVLLILLAMPTLQLHFFDRSPKHKLLRNNETFLSDPASIQRLLDQLNEADKKFAQNLQQGVPYTWRGLEDKASRFPETHGHLSSSFINRKSAKKQLGAKHKHVLEHNGTVMGDKLMSVVNPNNLYHPPSKNTSKLEGNNRKDMPSIASALQMSAKNDATRENISSKVEGIGTDTNNTFNDLVSFLQTSPSANHDEQHMSIVRANGSQTESKLDRNFQMLGKKDYDTHIQTMSKNYDEISLNQSSVNTSLTSGAAETCSGEVAINTWPGQVIPTHRFEDQNGTMATQNPDKINNAVPGKNLKERLTKGNKFDKYIQSIVNATKSLDAALFSEYHKNVSNPKAITADMMFGKDWFEGENGSMLAWSPTKTKGTLYEEKIEGNLSKEKLIDSHIEKFLNATKSLDAAIFSEYHKNVSNPKAITADMMFGKDWFEGENGSMLSWHPTKTNGTVSGKKYKEKITKETSFVKYMQKVLNATKSLDAAIFSEYHKNASNPKAITADMMFGKDWFEGENGTMLTWNPTKTKRSLHENNFKKRLAIVS